MATGDLLKPTKAIWAGALGFIAPGVAVLIPQVAPGGDGIQGRELVWALLLSLAFAAGSGGTVYAVENKPKPGVLLGRARYVGEPESREFD